MLRTALAVTTESMRLPLVAAALLATLVVAAPVAALTGSPATYTLTADFNDGTPLNVVTTADEVKLDDTTTPFGFIWVAVSSKSTVVKIRTDTGAVVGEYRSAPESSGQGDTSRTTVDKNGSVWVGNRYGGSVVHIGLQENGRCVDRDNSGTIETSTGLGDVRPWPGTTAAEAADECIIHYTQTAGSDARHVSVDANNDVWVSNISTRIFQLIDGDTGAIVRTEGPVGYGGYGGLIDANGVIWSAQPMLRWDTANPLSGPNGVNWTGYGHSSYGLCIDPAGNVWNTSLDGNTIHKFDPAGVLIGTYSHGTYYAQGCVADTNGHIWVAGSLYGNTVDHLLNDGTYVGSVTVGSGPTGVAVDSNGKIWATNYNEGTVSRIDPALGPIGGGGGPVGAVDLTTVPLGGNTYNYSDMTGSTLIGAPDNGTWTVVHDTLIPAAQWGTVSWTQSNVVGDGSLTVTAATSDDGVNFSPPVAVTNGGALSVPDGQYIKVVVAFARASTGESPILLDLTIATVPNIQCGDGLVQQGEECDDGNTTDGDGCDSSCVVEPCWVCVAEQGSTTTTLAPTTTLATPTTTMATPTTTLATPTTTMPGPFYPRALPGPSICTHDDGVSCDDGDECTVGDTCEGGTCGGNAVVIPAACRWVIVGDAGVQSRTRGQTNVTGHVCGDRVRLGEFSSTNGDAVATLATSVGVQISPHADVTGDIISGGSAVRGKPRLTLLPGLAVDVVAGGTTATRTDYPSKIYDTLGTHARVGDCAAAQGDVTAGDSLLALLPPGTDLGDTLIGAGGSLTLTATSPGGLNVFDFTRLRSLRDTTVTLDGAGDAGSVFVVRVEKKLDLRLRSKIVLAGGTVPGNVILYSQAKCRFGNEVVGFGTVFCPNGKLILEERTNWQGALVGGRRRVELRDSGVLVHAPLQVGP
ncbi:MAG: DUF3494 domain-containing protein [Deltaproteobacteria bacterium]|nr:DUF3494 domain-containing protein [Deltaproteobacteria bacterium]